MLMHDLRSLMQLAGLRACTHMCKKAARNLLSICCSQLVLTRATPSSTEHNANSIAISVPCSSRLGDTHFPGGT